MTTKNDVNISFLLDRSFFPSPTETSGNGDGEGEGGGNGKDKGKGKGNGNGNGNGNHHEPLSPCKHKANFTLYRLSPISETMKPF